MKFAVISMVISAIICLHYQGSSTQETTCISSVNGQEGNCIMNKATCEKSGNSEASSGSGTCRAHYVCCTKRQNKNIPRPRQARQRAGAVQQSRRSPAWPFGIGTALQNAGARPTNHDNSKSKCIEYTCPDGSDNVRITTCGKLHSPNDPKQQRCQFSIERTPSVCGVELKLLNDLTHECGPGSGVVGTLSLSDGNNHQGANRVDLCQESNRNQGEKVQLKFSAHNPISVTYTGNFYFKLSISYLCCTVFGISKYGDHCCGTGSGLGHTSNTENPSLSSTAIPFPTVSSIPAPNTTPKPAPNTTPKPIVDSGLPKDCCGISEKEMRRLGKFNGRLWEVVRKIKPFDKEIEVMCIFSFDVSPGLLMQNNTYYLYEEFPDHFEKDWKSYENGFGRNNGSVYWLGLKHLHEITSNGDYEMHIYLGFSYHWSSKFVYYPFTVSGAEEKYKLNIKFESSGLNRIFGDSGGKDPKDAIANYSVPEQFRANGMPFSTFDKDNDMADYNCAQFFQSGWWFNNCADANPNGKLLVNAVNPDKLHWSPMHGWQSLTLFRMLLVPRNGC